MRVEKRNTPEPHLVLIPTTDEECQLITECIGEVVPTPFAGVARLSDGYGSYYLYIQRELKFTCPKCNLTSHNPNDAANHYCGNCNEFFS